MKKASQALPGGKCPACGSSNTEGDYGLISTPYVKCKCRKCKHEWRRPKGNRDRNVGR